MSKSVNAILPRRGASPRRLVAAAAILAAFVATVVTAWQYFAAMPEIASQPWQFAPGFYVTTPANDEETLLNWDGVTLDPWLHFHNGRAYYLKEDFDAAYREFSAALADDPSLALAYWYRGLIQRHWQNEAAAMIEFGLAHWHDERLVAPTEFGPDFIEPDHYSLP